MRRRSTRRSALLIAVAMIAAVTVGTMGTASAGTPGVVVSQTSGLIAGQSLSVAVTSDVTNSNFYAVTQCGNADSSGNSIAPGNQNDCAGATQMGVGLQIISNSGPTYPASLGGGLTTGTVYTVTITALKTGIGTNNAQCVPVDATHPNPCVVAVAESDATQAQFGQVLVPITYRLPATVAISSVTGQNAGVTTAARSGNTLQISGVNWDPSGTLTASLCDVTLTTCDATGLTGTATTDGTGNVASAGLTVTATATSGARALKVTDGTQTASTPVQILGTRAVTLSPTGGGIGTGVTVNGTNYDASQAVAIQALDATFAPLGAAVVTSSSTVGAVNGVFTIGDSATKYIAAAETDAPLTDNALAPFAFSADSCNNVGCTVLQTVTLAVDPGVINITQAGNAVGMSTITLDGTTKTSTGDLKGITITDARGTLNGWSVTATMNDLTGPGGSNSTIPAGNMKVVAPTCATQTVTTGSNTGITAGATAQAFDPTTALSLCTAASGQGGGTYSIGSGLSLTVPPTVRSGTYTSTITVLLT